MAAMGFALERSDTAWSEAFREIVRTEPFNVTETQLLSLYRAIRTELWPQDAQYSDELPDEQDPLLYVVRFCKGLPSILSIMSDVHTHLENEYTWMDHAQIMCLSLKRTHS